LINVSLGPTQKLLEGTVVAWCPSNSNDGALVQVVFDDKSAPTTLTIGEFNQSRAAYSAAHPEHLTVDEEAKLRIANERRFVMEKRDSRGGRRGERGRGSRGERGRGSRDNKVFSGVDAQHKLVPQFEELVVMTPPAGRVY